ncbi:MAG TPA: hypothetical protein VEX88_14915, partial [Glaciibacter sp.]|nr:hypothetical protein [Glaciibacter sp.]
MTADRPKGRTMFRILIVLCLAAASFGAAAQEPPGELAPQQDLYLIVLQPDQRGEPPFDPSSFGGRLEHRKGSRLAVRMTAEAAAAVEQNPRVRTIQLITLGRTDRPEGARAGARVIAHGNDSLTGGIYTYDGSGNIRSIGPNGDGGTDQFTYDEFGRLASAKVHSGGMPYLESYGYDGAGNLTQLVKPNLTINLPVEAATNRLSSSLGVAYDDTGHLTQSPVGSYEYDQVGMMSGTSEGRTYIYTASGERILI